MLLTLSLIGVAINGFAKNIAQDLAIDTARFAALADQDASSATERAYKVLGPGFGKVFHPNVMVQRKSISAQCSYAATVTLSPISFGFLSTFASIRESALAVCELQE